jgi:hypothetical protein
MVKLLNSSPFEIFLFVEANGVDCLDKLRAKIKRPSLLPEAALF